MSAAPESVAKSFACGGDNPIGLRIILAFDGDTRRVQFAPHGSHVSWEDTLHAGTIDAALDDLTGNAPYFQGQMAPAARCEVRYCQPLRANETVLLSGWTEQRQARLMVLEGEARRKSDNELIADCTANFLVER